ncbi:MAG: cytidylate kinase [Desulfobacterales bacterium]|nr:MAG: cytidylate kinase [Desulfobacterales bacterium]
MNGPVPGNAPALLITIDGPAGAGKTTVSRRLARELGYAYVDTGALYRAVAWAAREHGIGPKDDAALAAFLPDLSLSFDGPEGRIHANGKDIAEAVRTPEISMLASAISARPCVRRFLLDVQIRLGKWKSAVFEGRDMGTVVFPDADIKFFLTADMAVRARRRFDELRKCGEPGGKPPQTCEQVAVDLQRRDRQDAGRDIAPLKPAHDAIHIDASLCSVEEVVSRMMTIISAHLSEGST